MAEMKKFTVDVKLCIIAQKTVVADTFAQAVEQMNGMKVADFVSFKTGIGHLDSNAPVIVSVATGDWLD